MPLYKSIHLNSQTIVKVWKISEPLESLLYSTDLNFESLERVNGMNSELHRRAFLSVRMLLINFGAILIILERCFSMSIPTSAELITSTEK